MRPRPQPPRPRRPAPVAASPPASPSTDPAAKPDHRDAAHHQDTPGHPDAAGTLPMAHHLTDPATEAEIQALAAQAPPMTEDQRATLARLLRLHRRRGHAACTPAPEPGPGS